MFYEMFRAGRPFPKGNNNNQKAGFIHRQITRENLFCNYRVFDSCTSKVMGYIIDVSLDGVRLKTEELIEQGETRQLRIVLPKRSMVDGVYRGERLIGVNAVAAWNSESEQSSFYECGFKFLNLDTNIKALLTELIRDCHR